MIVDLVFAVLAGLGEAVGKVVAGRDALAAVDALILVPDQAAFQRVDLVAGAVGDATHGDVLARAAEAARAVALDMGEVDHEIRVMDESGDVHMPEGLEIHFFRVEVLAQMTAVVQHGTSQIALGVAALFRMALVDIVVGDEAIAAVRVDEIHQLADKDRGNRGIGDAGADVHLDGDGLAVHLVAQTALFQHAAELFGQGLGRFVARVGHGREEYFGCHVKSPFHICVE